MRAIALTQALRLDGRLDEPFYRDVIRAEPRHAARVLQGLTIGVSHPSLYGDEPMDPADVARLFLDGLRVRGKRTAKGVSC